MINLKEIERIYIYQYGKVGSCTLLKTLKRHHSNVHHTHLFEKNMLLNNTLIVNVVRNLYDRNISAFFQNINAKKYPSWYYCPKKDNEKIKMKHLMNHYKKVNIEHLKSDINTWYERFNNHLKTDIFDKKFNFQDKYSLYTSNNRTILTLRYEDISEWTNILGKIFNLKINLLNNNLTVKKPTYQLYIDFKKQYKYSEEECHLVKEIDHVKHFYTPEELEKYKNQYQ